MSKVKHLSPPTLFANPAYSQAVVIPAGMTTVIVGGQNGIDTSGRVVSKKLTEQSAQAIENLEAALDAAGCRLEDLVLTRIYLVAGSDLREAFGPWQAKWGKRANPPAVVGVQVAALANPDYLIEIEAMAARA